MKRESYKKNEQLVVLVLDGFGIAPDGEGNALSKAVMTNWKRVVSKYPSASLESLYRVNKNISQSEVYSIFGGNFMIDDAERGSLCKILSEQNTPVSIMAEPDRLPLSGFFYNNGGDFPESIVFSPQSEEGAKIDCLPLRVIFKELIGRIKNRERGLKIVFSSVIEMAARKGDMGLTILILEEMDRMIKSVIDAVLSVDGHVIIMATNGQAEEVIDMKTEKANKEISRNKTPFVLVGNDLEGKTMGFPEALSGDLSVCDSVGTVANIPSTILSFFGIDSAIYYDKKSLL